MIEVFGNKPANLPIPQKDDPISLVRIWTKDNKRCWKITEQPDGQLQIEVLSVNNGFAHDVPVKITPLRSNLIHLDA